MTIHMLHEAANNEQLDTLTDARAAMLADKSDPALRETYIRTAMMVLETYIITVGGLRSPIELLSKGNFGGFDELVDLFDTRGTGFSEALFREYLNDGQRAIVEAYTLPAFSLDIAGDKGYKLGVDVASFPLVKESATVYSILNGAIISPQRETAND